MGFKRYFEKIKVFGNEHKFKIKYLNVYFNELKEK